MMIWFWICLGLLQPPAEQSLKSYYFPLEHFVEAPLVYVYEHSETKEKVYRKMTARPKGQDTLLITEFYNNLLILQETSIKLQTDTGMYAVETTFYDDEGALGTRKVAKIHSHDIFRYLPDSKSYAYNFELQEKEGKDYYFEINQNYLAGKKKKFQWNGKKRRYIQILEIVNQGYIVEGEKQASRYEYSETLSYAQGVGLVQINHHPTSLVDAYSFKLIKIIPVDEFEALLLD